MAEKINVLAVDDEPYFLELFTNRFSALVEALGSQLRRTAVSTNVKERLDFSCALFDRAGEMLAQAAHIPVHLGSMPLSVQAALAAFDPAAMSAGDRFVVNDPFAGGTHLPDITVIATCILPGEKTSRFFVANRAHHADIGASSPGSMPVSRSVLEEGRVIEPVHLLRRGKRQGTQKVVLPEGYLDDLDDATPAWPLWLPAWTGRSTMRRSRLPCA